MDKIRIFDIDGTITHPGTDLWYMVTKSLCPDKESVEKYVSAWKNEIKAGINPYKASKSMMLKGIHLMPNEITGNDIKLETEKISKNIIKNGDYFEGAIQHINNSIDKGFYVIFSTTNYYETGLGFLDILVEYNKIEKNKLNSILVSGSRIDWKNKKIIHFNMGQCKIKDICERLNLTLQDLIETVDSFYGDDPEGNDSALLNLPLKGFVIKNDKNKNCLLPKHVLLADWNDIISYYP